MENEKNQNQKENQEKAPEEKEVLRKDEYIPVKFGDIGRFLLAILFLGLSIIHLFYVIPSAWKLLGLGNLSSEQEYPLGQISICWVFLGQYFLMSLTAICLVAMFKKGFKNLKPISKKGLIAGFIYGLIAGFIYGLIAGFIHGLIAGFILGFIYGFILGLIIGLIFGLIFGLDVEFK